MKRARALPWTSQELEVLREFYPTGGYDAVCDLLPDRARQSIYVMANRLGLSAPKHVLTQRPKLSGEQLEEAIRLRQIENWSFARIGKRFGLSEVATANAILIALCPRLGFKPAERDENGNLLPAEIERLRGYLRKGVRGVDIALRMGISQGRIAEERRRYTRELKAKRKMPLPAPGNGERYSGARLSREDRARVEQLLMDGIGAPRISDRTGVSKTQILRIRSRLIRRLRRKGECLPGCDAKGRRIRYVDAINTIPAESIVEFRRLILDRVPVARAARMCCIGGSSAYRLRDEIAAELTAQGLQLPPPEIMRGRKVEQPWMPKGPKAISRFRALLRVCDPAEARRRLEAEQDEAARRKLEADRRAAEEAKANRRPLTFEEQLERVRTGVAGIAAKPVFVRPGPNVTLGGIASAAL